MEKLKIIQIIKGLDIGGYHGGAERFGVELARVLQNTHEVYVCCFWRHSTDSELYWLNLLNKSGIEVFFAIDWYKKFHFISYCSGFLELIKKASVIKPHIIHSHFQIGNLVAITTKLLGISKVILRTSHILVEWGNSWEDGILRCVFTNLIFPLFMDIEVAITSPIASKLAGHLGNRLVRRKVFTIPNGINLDYLIQFQKKETIIKNQVFTIGSIGRLTEQKGYEYLIQAIPIIKKCIPPTQLIIIGDGDEKQYLANMISALGLNNDITLAGTQTDIPNLLLSFDVFVLPSLWEGLPTVLLECMALRIPVIASNISGITDLIINDVTGKLFSPKNPQAIANSVIEFYFSKTKSIEFTNNAFEKVKEYSFTHISQKYDSLYQELLDRVLNSQYE